MITAAQTRREMDRQGEYWRVALMDFVDDFRRHGDPATIAEPFAPGEPRFDALLASVIEQLCKELRRPIPSWVEAVPASPRAWFVSGFESLKAIALVESPLSFRMRNIFVHANFLSRV
ncbi:MAG: hypothetical protein WD042_18250 [Phycisphaeraceae bacterium]